MTYLGLLHSKPLLLWQTTADPYLRRRHSNTQRQVLSVCGVSWCAQGLVWALRASLVGMGFDFKHDFTPPTIFLGFSFALGCGISFFGGIQHSPVDGSSAASCNFGVLTEEDELTSFYSAILRVISRCTCPSQTSNLSFPPHLSPPGNHKLIL